MLLGELAFGAPVAVGAFETGESGIAGTETLFYATEDFVSSPGDQNAHRYYRGQVSQPLLMRRSVVSRDTPVGRTRPAVGSFILENPDGIFDNVLNAGSIDGRQLVVKVLRRGQTLNEAITLFDGVMNDVSYTRETVRVGTRNKSSVLDDVVQPTKFAGTGGFEGGEDLLDKPKPLAFGYVFGVTPIYLGVVSTKHQYIVSGGNALPIQDVPAFYDSGVPLTKVTAASTPTTGEYNVNVSTGTVKIGGTAPEFPTCDVEGYKPGGVFKQTTADIIESLLVDVVMLSSTLLDSTSFTNLNTDQGAEVGIWVGTELRTANDVIEELLNGATTFGGFNRNNMYEVGQLKAPTGGSIATFDETNILSLTKLRGPTVIEPPSWRHIVGWKRNYTPTTNVAAGATEAQRTFMAEEFRETAATDNNINTKHLNSVDFFTRGLFRDEADASAEATRLVALYADKRLFRLRTMNVSPALDIGKVIKVTDSRFNFDNTFAVIVAWNFNFAQRIVELDIFI